MISPMGLAFAAYYFVGIFHPALGPRMYGREWPGRIKNARQRKLAQTQWMLISFALACLSITVWLYSFGIDAWTLGGLLLLGIAALSVIGGFVVGIARKRSL